MLDRIESVLVTPVGIRLSSPCRFDLLMGRSGSGDYAYGDRENGGVLKHAAMMGSVALIEAARKVADPRLAERLLGRAWKTLQVTAPFETFKNPYVLAGNPRFCTQYTNPATGEHIGPLLSGTAPWMWLAYLSMMGISFREGRVLVDPILPPEWNGATLELNVPAGRYHIEVRKPAGLTRSRDCKPDIRFEGRSCGPELPVSGSNQTAKVEVLFR
jgi:cellobiose phosphorylase